jgi:hypothetical protein
LTTALFLAGAPRAAAQADAPRLELFAGYSFLPADGNDFPRQDSSGIQASLAASLTRWFAVVGDFGAHFNETSDLGFNYPAASARTSVYELLAGPRFAKRTARATLFGHALVGTVVGRSSLRGFEDSGFTVGGGGGVDVQVTSRFGLRGQFDLLGSFADIVEDNARFGVGVVVKIR